MRIFEYILKYAFLIGVTVTSGIYLGPSLLKSAFLSDDADLDKTNLQAIRVDFLNGVGDNFIAKIKRFESPTEITLSDGTTKLRRYDVELTDGTKIEFKDWSDWKSWSNSTFKKQFVNDLANPEFTELGKLKWIFNRTNIDEITLKSKALKALRKADGSPADELIDKLDDNMVKKLFPNDQLIDEINYAERLLVNLSEETNFEKIFEVVD